MWCLSLGDVYTLHELSGLQAFTERDSRGWLPLHRAAVQSQGEVLDQVLLGERTTYHQQYLTTSTLNISSHLQYCFYNTLLLGYTNEAPKTCV